MHVFKAGELQDGFLERLQPRLENDERIRAAWLEGSFGRDDADRYSDIDRNVAPFDGADKPAAGHHHATPRPDHSRVARVHIPDRS